MDLQKIAQEAVKAAAQAGTVNFNFNDIHHNENVFLGMDGKVVTSNNKSEKDTFQCEEEQKSSEEDDSQEKHAFCISAERWVEMYGNVINHKFRTTDDLVNHIRKLRERYIEMCQNGQPKTTFLREQIFEPKTPWLNYKYDFPAEAIRDLFDDQSISDKMVTDAKNKSRWKSKK